MFEHLRLACLKYKYKYIFHATYLEPVSSPCYNAVPLQRGSASSKFF